MAERAQEKAKVVQAFDRMVREQVAPQLRELGFTGTFREFSIRRGAARGALRWEKSGKWVRFQQLLPFTANVNWWCGSGRIGELLPAPAGDTWWDLHDDDPTGPVADEVVAAIRTYVLPAVDGLIS